MALFPVIILGVAYVENKQPCRSKVPAALRGAGFFIRVFIRVYSW